MNVPIQINGYTWTASKTHKIFKTFFQSLGGTCGLREGSWASWDAPQSDQSQLAAPVEVSERGGDHQVSLG